MWSFHSFKMECKYSNSVFEFLSGASQTPSMHLASCASRFGIITRCPFLSATTRSTGTWPFVWYSHFPFDQVWSKINQKHLSSMSTPLMTLSKPSQFVTTTCNLLAVWEEDKITSKTHTSISLTNAYPTMSFLHAVMAQTICAKNIWLHDREQGWADCCPDLWACSVALAYSSDWHFPCAPVCISTWVPKDCANVVIHTMQHVDHAEHHCLHSSKLTHAQCCNKKNNSIVAAFCIIRAQHCWNLSATDQIVPWAFVEALHNGWLLFATTILLQ